MAAQATLKDAGLGSATDNLFWIDPWSAEGQQLSAKLLPVAHAFRVHAEQSYYSHRSGAWRRAIA